MKLRYFIIFILISLITSTAFIFKKVDYRKGKDSNVCKSLRGDVLVYVIFVDSKYHSPWTQFDIQNTMDSMKVCIDWVKNEASKNNVDVNLITDYYLGSEFATVSKALPDGSVKQTISTPNLSQGIVKINKWGDYIARKAGDSFNLAEIEGIPDVKKPKNKERLIAYLRDQNKTKSVALLYMVNNYYKDDISAPVNVLDDNLIEFAVVGHKYPSILAHNILHLFGAADLYKTIYRGNEKNIELAQDAFPNDIMQDVYAKNISSFNIGDYTKYLIGWSDELDPKYNDLLFDKSVRVK